MVSRAVAMVYRIWCQPASRCLCHGDYVMLALACSWQHSSIVLSVRPHHMKNPATALYSRESLLPWLGGLQHMLLIDELSVQWPPWSGLAAAKSSFHLHCFKWFLPTELCQKVLLSSVPHWPLVLPPLSHWPLLCHSTLSPPPSAQIIANYVLSAPCIPQCKTTRALFSVFFGFGPPFEGVCSWSVVQTQ